MQRDATSRLRRVLWTLALAGCFAASGAAVVAGSFHWLRGARLGRPTLVFDYSRMMGKRLPALAEARRPGRPTVAMLGDSALVSYPEGRTVPARLQERLDADVASLGMSGSGPFDYYFLADRIAAARPDVVVVALNLDHFSRAWQGAYSRPQLAGWIAPARLLEALRMPLDWIGLTTDRLLFYVGLVQAGGYDPWTWLTLRQAQVGRARDRFEAWLQGAVDASGDRRDESTPERRFRAAADARTLARLFTDPEIRHYREEGVREHYDVTLAGLPSDHPVLRVLGACIDRFRRAGARVLVYVAPLEVTYLESRGLLDRTGLARTIATIEAAVRAHGGSFADFHDLLPGEAFRDAPGHLAYPRQAPAAADDGGRDATPDGPARLADALAPVVRDVLRHRAPAAR